MVNRIKNPLKGLSNTESLPRKEKTSVLVRNLLRELPTPEVSIGHIVGRLRRRSFGGILLLLAALGLLPGISLLAGMLLVVIGLQMLAGFRAPLLPKFVRRRRVDSNRVKEIGEKCIKIVERIESLVKPRYLFLTGPPMPNVIGLVVVLLGLLIMSPFPFSNLPAAIALLIISAGLLERDGIMIAAGIAFTAIAMSIGLLIAYFAVESLMLFFNKRLY